MDYIKYKISDYAYLFHSIKRNDSDLLFSSLTGKIFKITGDNKESIRKLFSEPIDNIDDILFDFLKKNCFITKTTTVELEVLKRRFAKAKSSTEDLFVTFVLTEQCNYRCHYCYQEHFSKKLSKSAIDKDIKLIEKLLPQYKNLKAHFFGGEPFLEFEMIEYISYMLIDLSKKYGKKYNSAITTNGSLLHSSHIKKLKKMKINQLQFTLDGSEEDHNKLRVDSLGKGTFLKTIEAIKIAIQFNFAVLVRINISPINVKNISHLLDFLLLNEITPQNSLVYLNEMKNIGYSKSDNSLYFQTTQKYSDAYVLCLSELLKRGFRFDFKPINMYCVFDKPSTLFFGTSGNLFHCSTGTDLPMADVDVEGVITNKTKRMEKLYSKEPWNDPKCKACKVLPLCMGGCSYLEENYKEKCSAIKYSVEQVVRLVAETQSIY